MTHNDIDRHIARVMLKLEWKQLLRALCLPDLRELGYQPAIHLLNSISVTVTPEQESAAADHCISAGMDDFAVRLLYCLQTARELAEAASTPVTALMVVTALIRAVEMMVSDGYPVGQIFYAATFSHSLTPFLFERQDAFQTATDFLGDMDVWSLMLNWRDAANSVSAAN